MTAPSASERAPDAASQARETADFVIKNARIVLADEVVFGSIRVENGRIAAVDGGSASVDGIDFDGDLLAPGLIELHTDNLERHMQPRPGVHWPRPAAVAAHDAELASVGVTTVFDAIRVGSVLSFARASYGRYAREAADAILALKRAGALRISHFLHLRAEICSETLLEEMDAFGPEDDVRIVSLMDHTPGFRQFRDLDKLRQYHQGKHRSHDMDFDAYIAFLTQLSSQVSGDHLAGAVDRARALGAVLASHDDTEVEHVEISTTYGARLAEFPTTRAAAAASRHAGIAVMMGAPNLLRGGSHSGNVAAQELAEAGLLDVLSSDYAPSSLLLGAMKLGELRGDVAAGLATATRAPARAAGLDDRGEIAPGLRADLLRIADAHEVPTIRGVWVSGERL